MQQKQAYSQLIKTWAKDLGFLFCGVAKADFLENEAPRLEAWLNKGMHGEMGYMENYFDKRLDPRLLVEGAKSVISLGLNYYTEDKQTDLSGPKISKYAYGADYHHVIKGKFKEFLALINVHICVVVGRSFVDSAPLLYKTKTKKTKQGWVG